MNKKEDKSRIDRLIEFFKKYKRKKPDPDQADYSSWHQTEAEYQKEQADWLKKVKQKNQNKKESDE